MNTKPPTIEGQTRAQIAQTLPHAIERAIASYHQFYDQPTPDEAKEFSAHHSACKAAIAHIELLLKLARWADLPDTHEDQSDLKVMLEQAQDELNGTQKDE
jgi:hypothetical protein